MTTWATAQCPFAIAYIPQVLEDIRTASVFACHGLAQGGLEIGGILLGKSSAERVTITDFLPMRCEHAFGPSFQFSTADHERMATAIAGAKAEGQTVVGWFHSRTQTGVFLSASDVELYNRHFGEPWQVALVLNPVPGKPTLCGFFFREADGSIHSSASYREFELDQEGRANDPQEKASVPDLREAVADLAAAPQVRRQPPAAAELPVVPQEAPAKPPPAPEAPTTRQPASRTPAARAARPWENEWTPPLRSRPAKLHVNWPRVLTGALIVVAIGVTYAFLDSAGTGARPTVAQRPADPAIGTQTIGGQSPDAPALGLKMQRQGTDLVLTWNRDLPEALGATAGLLTIKDGRKRKELGLSAEQLRSANILITPESDQVEVQLLVVLPNQRVATESGIVILPAQGLGARRVPAPPQVIPAQVPSAPQLPAPIQPTQVHPAGIHPAPAPPTQTSAASVPPKVPVPWSSFTAARVRPGPGAVKARKAFIAPPDRSRASEATLSDEPPALKGIGPAERTQPLPLASIRTFRVFAPAPRTNPADTTASPASSVDPSQPSRIGGNAQPAELVSSRNPIYPEEARARRASGVVVLEGVVSTNGRVRSLKVISGLEIFRQAAKEAVSQWKYRPAMLNGKPVESPVHVEVRFGKDM